MNATNKQQGATLVVSLIMLVVLTLLVVSAIRSSNTNLRITGNMQMQSEVNAAAQLAIEQVISSNFTAAPTEATIAVDINRDGASDYSVHVPKPSCNSTKALKNSDLDVSKPADQVCLGSGALQNTGIMGNTVASSAQSWCYKQQWEVQAQVSDGRSGANTTQHQGVSLRVPAGTTC
jgi:Tfp pilus assembly protein PilX